jgi:outer membrane lipoprotein-sorting protein
MKNFYLFIIFSLLTTQSLASTKKDIIKNLQKTNNLSFNFEQNINGKIQKGKCIIKYPKKIFCQYKLKNKKILVSDGKLLAIKTITSYYLYPIKKTPLNLILDKDFILDKINSLNDRIVDDKFINFTFKENDNEINLFFDKNTHNLIGWQTIDIYQNISITYLSSIVKNQKLKENLFTIPKQN